MVDGVTPRAHRGVLVLILGIIGIVMCMPCGIAAWVMGNGDLKAMQRGEMDRSGEGMTQAGKICGMISVALTVIAVIIWTCIAIFAVAASTHQ
jgi:hypothetical protein